MIAQPEGDRDVTSNNRALAEVNKHPIFSDRTTGGLIWRGRVGITLRHSLSSNQMYGICYDQSEAYLESAMITELMVQPSSWVETGITVETVRGLKLFKFTEELQEHFEELIELYKQDQLTDEQQAELRGLTELDRIFTLLNARTIADS